MTNIHSRPKGTGRVEPSEAAMQRVRRTSERSRAWNDETHGAPAAHARNASAERRRSRCRSVIAAAASRRRSSAALSSARRVDAVAFRHVDVARRRHRPRAVAAARSCCTCSRRRRREGSRTHLQQLTFFCFFFTFSYKTLSSLVTRHASVFILHHGWCTCIHLHNYIAVRLHLERSRRRKTY